MENRFEYVTFQRTDVADFDELILPNIYGELLACESFADHNVICVGAFDGGKPCGALVSVLSGDDELRILSIWVEPEARGNGVGSEMIRLALAEVVNEVRADGGYLKLTVSIDYALPAALCAEFEAFLASAGFKSITEDGRVYSLTAPRCGGGDTVVTALSDASEGFVTEFFNAVEEAELPVDADLSFFTGTEDDQRILILSYLTGDGDVMISSSVFADDVTKEEYENALGKVFDAIRTENGDVFVAARADSNVFGEVWEKVASEYGEVCVEKSARRYLVIE